MQFLQTPTGSIAVIDGVLPTVDEWKRIFSERALINVISMPGSANSLDLLVPHANSIVRLAVNSSSCTDLRAIERMPHLEWLLVGGLVAVPPDVSKLTELVFFGGDPEQIPGVLGLPSISKLTIKWRAVDVAQIAATTIDLTVMEARGMHDLTGLVRLAGLSSLTVHGARSLDLRALGEFPALRTLTLNAIGAIRGAEAIISAPRLEQLVLEQCPVVDSIPSLQSFAGTVRVVGRNPFSREFRVAAGAKWSFPR
jgi:hypothetical protein